MTIDNERREFMRTVAQIQDAFPDVFLLADAENLLVWIFGSNDDAKRATEIAQEALNGGPAHVQPVVLVTCSQSLTPRMMRGLNEPVSEQPRIIGYDDRGVFLRCLPSAAHTHDWGGSYESLNPHVSG